MPVVKSHFRKVRKNGVLRSKSVNAHYRKPAKKKR